MTQMREDYVDATGDETNPISFMFFSRLLVRKLFEHTRTYKTGMSC